LLLDHPSDSGRQCFRSLLEHAEERLRGAEWLFHAFQEPLRSRELSTSSSKISLLAGERSLRASFEQFE